MMTKKEMNTTLPTYFKKTKYLIFLSHSAKDKKFVDLVSLFSPK